MLLISTTVFSVTGLMNITIPREVDKNIVTNNEPEPLPTKAGYLSIPAAAFTPMDNNKDIFNFGYYLGTSELSETYCVAPVYLPDNAEVIRVAMYWVDINNAMDIVAKLYRYGRLSGKSPIMMAELTSYGTGEGYSEDKTIEDPVINNGLNCYYILLGFAQDMCPEYLVIEYNYKTSINIINSDISNNPYLIKN